MADVQIDPALTDEMLENALAECAETHFNSDVARLRQALAQGQCHYCKCVTECLINQISEYLGQVDRTVKAIYHYRQVNAQQAALDEEDYLERHTGINLVAWVDRKSAALSALIEMLEKGLAASQRGLGCAEAEPACFTLDVSLVDTGDIQERRGLGLLVADSTHLHSELVWKRPTRPGEPPPEKVERAPEPEKVRFSLPEIFDPELIPEARLIEHARILERLVAQEGGDAEPHLIELKVALIRRMISDQLPYINIAKRFFSVADLANIYQHRIGFGKIGGKAAGMLLAERILCKNADSDLLSCVKIPESYFLGSELVYIFMSMNGLMYWNDQKYKSEEQIRDEYPRIQEEFRKGSFPPETLVELQTLLARVGKQPIIVRSSSQLEDNFGTSFAGKYRSFFLPNQGTPEENLRALTQSIALIFASALNPDALLYRRSKNLQDYDERMAALIQVVQGEQFGRYYLPFAAGVGFSHNLYRWAPQIRREDGFARMVWGLGTHAVERGGNDYPRLVALSHPALQPDDEAQAVGYYSQKYVDLIDLQENAFKRMPVRDLLSADYPPLRYLVQIDSEGYLATPRGRILEDDLPRALITYDELLRKTSFAPRLSRLLKILEENYRVPVDVEFTASLEGLNTTRPVPQIMLLQCRPQSHLRTVAAGAAPRDLPEGDIIFSTHFMVPNGYLDNIRYVIYVSPKDYFALPTQAARNEVTRVVSALNSKLEAKTFICVGPGRWGTTNPDLGVFVNYADIFNAGALVELSGASIGLAPEPSFGTHFFQDLMEAQIYPLALLLDERRTQFRHSFFEDTPNALAGVVNVNEQMAGVVRLIDVAAYRPGCHLEVVLDGERNQTVAFLVGDKKPA